MCTVTIITQSSNQAQFIVLMGNSCSPVAITYANGSHKTAGTGITTQCDIMQYSWDSVHTRLIKTVHIQPLNGKYKWFERDYFFRPLISLISIMNFEVLTLGVKVEENPSLSVNQDDPL